MEEEESAPLPVIKTVSLNVQNQQPNQLNAEYNKDKNDEQEMDDLNEIKGYPFAAVLRIRVLQVEQLILVQPSSDWHPFPASVTSAQLSFFDFPQKKLG